MELSFLCVLRCDDHNSKQCTKLSHLDHQRVRKNVLPEQIKFSEGFGGTPVDTSDKTQVYPSI